MTVLAVLAVAVPVLAFIVWTWHACESIGYAKGYEQARRDTANR